VPLAAVSWRGCGVENQGRMASLQFRAQGPRQRLPLALPLAAAFPPLLAARFHVVSGYAPVGRALVYSIANGPATGVAAMDGAVIFRCQQFWRQGIGVEAAAYHTFASFPDER